MKTKTMTIALTLNWRDAARTMLCIESLLDQDIDHILVWDNSADDGASFTKLAHLLSGNPKVSIVQSPTNLGFAAGVNRGLAWINDKFPKAEFALLINNDATIIPGGVNELRKALNSIQDAWLAYPDINQSGHIFGDAYYQRHTGLITFKKIPGSFPYTSGCCQLFALNRIQKPIYDEDFFMYGEDIELGWRLSRIPGSTVHVSKVLVHHEGSASSKIGSPFYEKRMAAAHLALAKKLSIGTANRITTRIIKLCTLTARAILRSIRYHSPIPLLAIGQEIHASIRPESLKNSASMDPSNTPHQKKQETLEWSRGQLEHYTMCPVCSDKTSNSHQYIRHGNNENISDSWKMLHCKGCGSIYLDPYPTTESLSRAYETYYTHSEDPGQRTTSRLINGYLNHRFGTNRKPELFLGSIIFSLIEPFRLKLDYYGRNLDKLKDGETKRLLDIGCGNGAFILRAEEMGRTATGCEPDPIAAETCKKQGIEVIQGDAFSHDLDDRQFEEITMSHVLEHVFDPKQLLKRAHQLLTKNGLIWIAIPNTNALGLHIFGRSWIHLHPPFHLIIPSRTTLEKWLFEAGFQEVKFVRRGAQSHAMWKESEKIYTRENPGKHKYTAKPLRLLADIITTITPIWSEETIVIAKK